MGRMRHPTNKGTPAGTQPQSKIRSPGVSRLALIAERSRNSPERLLILSAAAILAFLFVWFQLQLVLLAFAGVLLAVMLRTITRWIEHHTRLNGMLAYAATLALIAAAGGLVAWLIAPRAINQMTQVAQSMPTSIHQLEKPLEHSTIGREILAEGHKLAAHGDLNQRLPQIARAVAGGATDLIIVVVIGFFAALHPRGYKEGLLVIFPEAKRERARTIFNELERQLRWWLFGQMLPMAVLGVASAIGLWVLGVHLPWTLGLVTGLAVFLPYAGTVLAGVPSVLMGLQRSPQTALYVLILYTLLHLAEGYILTPLVQRRAVRLPPVLTILTQFFFWNVSGILGLAVAAPLASAGIVLVKELYFHVPADREIVPDLPGEKQKAA